MVQFPGFRETGFLVSGFAAVGFLEAGFPVNETEIWFHVDYGIAAVCAFPATIEISHCTSGAPVTES